MPSERWTLPGASRHATLSKRQQKGRAPWSQHWQDSARDQSPQRLGSPEGSETRQLVSVPWPPCRGDHISTTPGDAHPAKRLAVARAGSREHDMHTGRKHRPGPLSGSRPRRPAARLCPQGPPQEVSLKTKHRMHTYTHGHTRAQSWAQHCDFPPPQVPGLLPPRQAAPVPGGACQRPPRTTVSKWRGR